jgi:UDP:flavonoid glycosyltransferase YjiC (YdhE family)
VCGFFFRQPPTYTPPAPLAEFLASGPAPVYIGFGSIVLDDPRGVTEMVLAAVAETGVRAVISRGWGGLGEGMQDEGENKSPLVFWLDECPHEWLFGRVRAVVHHGGAGTTACGLLNGRPTCVVPFFGEYGNQR